MNPNITGDKTHNEVPVRNRERGYIFFTVNDEASYKHHMNYIHFNQVKHGYVKRAKERVALYKLPSLHCFGRDKPHQGSDAIDQGMHGE